MKILKYHPKKQTAEIEWEGEIVEISEETALKHRVDITKDIPEDLVPTLIAESEEVICLQYLYTQLDRYFKTKAGYYKKLREKGFSVSAAKSAVSKAEQNGFIDDAYYARRFIEQNYAKKGRFALKRDLSQKGIDMQIIEEALSELPEQEEELLRLAKKLYSGENTLKEKAALSRKLASRGFSYDEIHSVINKVFSEDFSDQA